MEWCGTAGLLLLDDGVVVDVFKLEVCAFWRGELATRVDVLAVFQVVDDALVAVDTRFSVYVSGEKCVLIMVLFGTGDENDALEFQRATVPTFLFHVEFFGTLFLSALFYDVGILGRPAVGFEFFECFCGVLDEQEVGSWANVATFGVRHVASAVVIDRIFNLWGHYKVVETFEEFHDFFRCMEECLVVKVSDEIGRASCRERV